jgi:hypothetical protein
MARPIPPQAFADTIRQGVELIGATFEKPDDDWVPAFFVLASTGTMIPMIFEGPLDEPGKQKMVQAMVGLARQTRAYAAVFVASSWMTEFSDARGRALRDQHEAFIAEHGRAPETYEEQGIVSPSEAPDRFEAVTMTLYTADATVMSWAPIERHDDSPPTLGEWTVLDSDEAEIAGRLSEPVTEQLRRNQQ